MHFTKSPLSQINKENKKVAIKARLVYISPGEKGISRIRKGKSFIYITMGRQVTNAAVLMRIKNLVIPPAWENVWISNSPRGHIQATGTDVLGRKQYRYHTSWSNLRNNNKFRRMYEFGKMLPVLRRRTKKDLAEKDLTSQKVIATAINLMEETYIRVGNNSYEKLHGSYGLTTLKDNHVDILKDSVKFSFIGKKGVSHSITLKNKKLAQIIKQCRDIPGKKLFQYYENNGRKKTIDSGMINSYLKANSGGLDISSKDFRTWAGTLQAIKSISKMDPAKNKTAIKQNLITILDEVSSKLGNTRTVCKKYYVHPSILDMYEKGTLQKIISQGATRIKGLSAEESVLMKLLKNLP